MEVVGPEADQAAGGVEELGIDVHEEYVFLVVEFGNDLVRLLALAAVGVRGTGAAGEDGQQQDLGVRKVLAEFQDVGADALGDFRAGAAGVVGADHEHDGLGLVALALPVLQSPEDALGGVARDGEVGDLHVAEVLVEDVLAARVAGRAPLFHQSVIESP